MYFMPMGHLFIQFILHIESDFASYTIDTEQNKIRQQKLNTSTRNTFAPLFLFLSNFNKIFILTICLKNITTHVIG